MRDQVPAALALPIARAQALLEMREFRRAAHALERPGVTACPLALFLRCYALSRASIGAGSMHRLRFGRTIDFG